MKRSVRPSVIRLPACPVSEWRRRPSAQAVVGLCGAIAALAGCTTLGTNINGSFACGAVGQGTCAPATVIDDRALAEITGDASYIPAGPFRPAPEGRPAVVAANASQQVATACSPVPVGQKVLRIVFPGHVDGGGRYHETSVVRAVVDNGSWMQASATHGVPLASTVNLTVSPDVLAQLDQAALDDAPKQVSALDPNMPSPAAVAAARARGAAKGGRPSVGAGPAPVAATEPKVAQVGVVNRPAAFNPKVED